MKKPNSWYERQIEATRFSNHHILTCTNEICKYLKATNKSDKSDTENKGKEKNKQTKQHDSNQLFRIVIKYSKVAYSSSKSE